MIASSTVQSAFGGTDWERPRPCHTTPVRYQRVESSQVKSSQVKRSSHTHRTHPKPLFPASFLHLVTATYGHWFKQNLFIHPSHTLNRQVQETQKQYAYLSITQCGNSCGHYARHAARIGPDHVCRIRLPASDSVPFFERRPGPHCAKSTRIRSGWPGQVWAKCIWSGSSPVCKNHRARYWQNAT